MDGKVTHINRKLSDKQLRQLQVFKVQIPISTNAPKGEELALIYNKRRTIYDHVPVSAVMQYFKTGEFKKYVYGYFDYRRRNLDLLFAMEVPEKKKDF